MAIGVTFTLRNATTTNTVSHNYSYNSSPNPDEETYTYTRYFNSHDTTGWDGVTETNYQGTTADGSIVKADTVIAGTTPTVSG